MKLYLILFLVLISGCSIPNSSQSKLQLNVSNTPSLTESLVLTINSIHQLNTQLNNLSLSINQITLNLSTNPGQNLTPETKLYLSELIQLTNTSKLFIDTLNRSINVWNNYIVIGKIENNTELAQSFIDPLKVYDQNITLSKSTIESLNQN